ncbi:MAG TPA: RluA family pseudouridine synthase [Tepidisphaeraceae bacterium]|nr:RluA family pseudouridine synthase [Tepidisphaeraceae bacterium]
MKDFSRYFQVEEADAGSRLDVFLAGRLKTSRRQVHRLLDDRTVSLDGRREHHKGAILAPGQQIEVSSFQPPEDAQVLPQPDVPLNVLASGDGWIALDKPPGIPVHPLKSDESQTLLNAAVARYPQIQNVGEGGLRSGVVHRLDVDTSGVILIATQQLTWERLRRAISEHRAQKIYRAIVAGELKGSDRLVLDLHVAQHSPARVKVVDAQSLPKPAGTRRCDLSWKSVQHTKDATLLEISLGTGFLHQIRAMMAHIGHPVLGDKTYGQNDPDVPRQMLHARSIRIEEIYAESPEPEDFVGALSSFNLR